jgi:hypothetical protein
MTSNSLFSCDVCGTTFRIRCQTSPQQCPVSFRCPTCLTSFTGSIPENGTEPRGVLHLTKSVKAPAGYVVEFSPDFVTSKIRKEDGVGKTLTPFLNNMGRCNPEKIEACQRQRWELSKTLPEVVVAADLYNHGKYSFVENFIKESKIPAAKATFIGPKSPVPSLSIDSLKYSHRFLIFGLKNTVRPDIFDLYDRIFRLLDEVDSHETTNLMEYLGGKSFFATNKQKIEELIFGFAGLYNNLFPLYILDWDLKKINLQTEGINSIDYSTLLIFYSKAFETLCDCSDLPIGLNNVAMRGSYTSFPSGEKDFSKYLSKYNTKTNKFHMGINCLEPFSFPFTGLCQNVIRNSAAHFSTSFDPLTQIIQFVDMKKTISMTLIEFAYECYLMYNALFLTLEILVQSSKYYLLSLELR